jgi:hypothetical protein
MLETGGGTIERFSSKYAIAFTLIHVKDWRLS